MIDIFLPVWYHILGGDPLLYQNILMGERTYLIRTSIPGAFEEHRHADLEIHYCMEGCFDICIDKTVHRIHAGELALIPAMVSHSVPKSDLPPGKGLMIIVGASFLKKDFSLFSSSVFTSPVCVLRDDSAPHCALRTLLEETAELSQHPNSTGDLFITGNLYKICGYLLSAFTRTPEDRETNTNLRAVANIEKALELIYYHSHEPITVEQAAAAAGYGKSNFCKIFKNTVGDTFHNMLNRQRVENACCYLRETVMPISEIAQRAGFSEAKTFCRVFRSVSGITPGEYRKQNNLPIAKR